MEKVLELEIDQDGQISLPDFLIRRLCLRSSVTVPLIDSGMDFFLMPSAFTAMLLGARTAEPEESRSEIPLIDEDDEEWTDEKIVAACRELRRSVSGSGERE